MAGARSAQLFRTGVTYTIPSGAALRIVDAPSDNNDLVRKTDLDTEVANLRTNVVATVRVIEDASNVNLASVPANIDGVAMVAGDLFAVAAQTDDTENGIYSYPASAGNAASRAADYDANGELIPGALIVATEGTNTGTVYIVGGTGTLNLGTDSIPITQTSATAAIADGSVTTAKLAADAVDGTKIADDAIDSEHIAAGAIDTEHLGAAQVTTAKIALDAIDGTLIADDVIDSEHYVAGSIDAEHLAADIIDGSKIADDVIDSEHYVAGSIDTEHIADDQVTQAKLAAAVNSLFAELADIPADGCVNISSSDGAGLVTYGGAGDTVDVAAGTFVNSAGERFAVSADTGIAIPDASAGERVWILVVAKSNGTYNTITGTGSSGAGLPTEPALAAGDVLLARVLKKAADYAGGGSGGVTEVTGNGDIWDARRALKGKLRTEDLTGDDSTTAFYLSRRLDRVNGLITIEDNIEMLKLVSGAPGAGEFSITDDPSGDGDLVTLGAAHGAADKMRVVYLG